MKIWNNKKKYQRGYPWKKHFSWKTKMKNTWNCLKWREKLKKRGQQFWHPPPRQKISAVGGGQICWPLFFNFSRHFKQFRVLLIFVFQLNFFSSRVPPSIFFLAFHIFKISISQHPSEVDPWSFRQISLKLNFWNDRTDSEINLYHLLYSGLVA